MAVEALGEKRSSIKKNKDNGRGGTLEVILVFIFGNDDAIWICGEGGRGESVFLTPTS